MADTSGNDVVEGTAGNDRFTVSQGGADTIDGKSGTDILVLEARPLGGGIKMQAPTLTPGGYSGSASWSNQSVTFSNVERFYVYSSTGDFADEVVTGDDDDIFLHWAVNNPGYAADTVDLRGGSDTLDAKFGAVSFGGVEVVFTGIAAGSTERAGYFLVGGSRKLTFSGADSFLIVGSAVADRLEGGDIKDRLEGEAGDDILVGNGGNDDLYGSFGSDSIFGGSGDDRGFVSLNGDDVDYADLGTGTDRLFVDVAPGTTGNIVLTRATTGPDGGAGSLAVGGDVRLTFAGVEAFNIKTGSGDDYIEGTDGQAIRFPLGEFLEGDRIETGEGNDTVFGGGGNDQIFGESGNDVLHGEDGNDSLNGGAGDDLLIGGSGSDHLIGGAGRDVMIGGEGDDGFDASGGGADSVDGGEGRDRLSGLDWSDLGPGQGVTIDLNTGSSFTVAGDGRYIKGIELISGLMTGAGDDSIVLNRSLSSSYTVSTGAGNDTVTVFSIDTVLGKTVSLGVGFDHLIVDSRMLDQEIQFSISSVSADGASGRVRGGFSTLLDYSGADRFTIFTAGRTDFINTASYSFATEAHAGGGNDFIRTGSGNDLLDGGAGDDELEGGVGNDIYIVDSRSDRVTEGAGQGTDEVRTNLFLYSLAANVETLTGSDASQNLTGNALDNIMDGGGGDDTLQGGAGNDQLFGGLGNDLFFGGAGSDRLDGGEGDDTIGLNGVLADYRFERIEGGYRITDLRSGGDGVDTLTNVEFFSIGNTRYLLDAFLPGTTGNDTVIGSSGPDLFRLEQGGDDTGSGGGGDDGFYLGATVTAADEFDGGAGMLDQLGLQGNYVGLTLGAKNLVGIEQLVLLSGGDTRFGDMSGALYSYDLETVDANVAAGDQLIITFNTLRLGEDVMIDGSAETDGTFLTFGGKGVDQITGGQGDDAFFFGVDKRFGDQDAVDGQAGSDQLGLQGNYAGTSKIVFGDAQLKNIEFIVALTGGDGRFGNNGAGYNYDLTTSNGNVEVGETMIVSANTLRSDETLSFDGSAELDGRFRIFSGAGVDMITGGAGDDEISGGRGADVLTGGDGADVFLYTSAADSSGTNFDRIVNFDFRVDKIDLPTTVGNFSDAIEGTINQDSFDTDLADLLNGVLGAGEAAAIEVNGGDMTGRFFGVVDANGVAGYQAGEDYVVEFVTPIVPPQPTIDFLV